MILGATDNAALLVRRNAKKMLCAAALSDLANLYYGNPLINQLDDAVRRRSSTPYTDFSR